VKYAQRCRERCRDIKSENAWKVRGANRWCSRRRRKKNANTEVIRWRRERGKERRITKELTEETNAYIARYGKGTKAREVWRKEDKRWLQEKERERKKERKKRDRHFKKTDLSIHQWTIKLIARHHANVQDRLVSRRRVVGYKTVSCAFSLFPYALFHAYARVLNYFRKERRRKKKDVLSRRLSPRQHGWVIATEAR